MSTPFFDDATRDLFDEIFMETLEEYREEKHSTPEPTPSDPEPVPSVGPQDDPETSPPEANRVDDAWTRLHRSMYVLSMHRGRPHAQRPEFQRKWLERALRSICIILATLPEEDET